MSTPVWTWLPGSPEPVLAGQVEPDPGGLGRGKFWYEPSYANHALARPLDPMRLRLSRKPRVISILGQATGLPGVLIDAMPAGYGQDRLNARHGRDLSPLELLELGPGDAVGAIAVCRNIEAKMAWRPHSLAELVAQIERLDDDAPSSRAIRSMDLDDGTSAGGERPKATIEVDGSLWIAKLQDRGDSAHLPAREFAVMELAGELGITVPRIRLHRSGRHEVFLIERFDRAGDPRRPRRHLFASAHSLLGLNQLSMPGDAARSYLVLADTMRRWISDQESLQADLVQLWKRMAYNALVGNKDDHPRNHGLTHDGTGWRLSKAFDITPLQTFTGLLSMSVLPDGSTDCGPASLLQVASHFGLKAADAAAWLGAAATHVASHWEARLRANGVSESLVGQFAPAFAVALELARTPERLEQMVSKLELRPRR